MSAIKVRRGRETGFAVKNTGTWGPIIAFLTEVGMHRVPFGSVPPVIRRADGVLEIKAVDGDDLIAVGGWLVWLDESGLTSYAEGGDIRDEYEIMESE